MYPSIPIEKWPLFSKCYGQNHQASRALYFACFISITIISEILDIKRCTEKEAEARRYRLKQLAC